MQPGPGFVPTAPAAMPTMAIAPDPQQPWGQPQPHQPQPQPHQPQPQPHQPQPQPAPAMSPELAAMLEGASADMMSPPNTSSMAEGRSLKTGMRKGRSKLAIAMWLIVGGLVIAGGVFVGFKFRAIRFSKKIDATRDIAIDLARADTWKGLVRSRDRLAGIAQASPTSDNQAAFARTRARIAFEFGDGLVDAKKSVDSLSGKSGLDIELADAYVQLAQHDAKAALVAAHRAAQIAKDDPAVLYVSGRAELMAGDPVSALSDLQAAVAKEPRPLYLVGLALALAADARWNDAMATLDQKKVTDWFSALDPDTARELKTEGIEVDKLAADHPAIAIARVEIAVAGGRLGGDEAKKLRAQLADTITEGGRGLDDQPRGVSPAQLAFAYLALSRIDYQLGSTTAHPDFGKALDVGLDAQGFAEQAAETAYFTGDYATAEKAVGAVLKEWPDSWRAAVTRARVMLVEGKPHAAIDALGKVDVDRIPEARVLRGEIRIALGDPSAAIEDFDGALEHAKGFEPAIVGRAWADLAMGKADAAKKEMTTYFKAASPPDTASPGVLTVWAAILQTSADHRAEAKKILEKLVAGPAGPSRLRARLELARVDRELGDPAAQEHYIKVLETTANPTIKLELATYLIDSQKPREGRETIDALLDKTEKPGPELLLEAARAHILDGDSKGAEGMLDRAEKLPGVVRWKYEREHARLTVRRGDIDGAATSIDKALDGCGADVETFFLAAEIAAADDKHKALGDKVKKLVARLGNGPETMIVKAKLLGSSGDVARDLYEKANEALEAGAPARRRAQAVLGRALVVYYMNRKDDPTAIDRFELAVTLDPSLFEAYLYLADLQGKKDRKKQLALAQKAVRFNPDSVDGWAFVATAAHALRNRKLFTEALSRVGALAPDSEQLKELQKLR